MGKTFKYENTIKDLKADFFDLFQEHTQEMVQMIELLAQGETEDSVQIESAIFQRIILLNKVGANVRHLSHNVGVLDTARENSVLQTVHEAEVTKIPQKVAAPPPRINAPVTAQNTTVPNVIVPKPAAITPQAPTAPVSRPTEPSAPISQISNPVSMLSQTAPQVVPTPKPPVQQSTPPVVETPKQDVTPAVTTPPIVEAPQKTEPAMPPPPQPVAAPTDNLKKPTKLLKKSDKKVKAILVSEKQYEKLNKSHDSQFKVLNFKSPEKTDETAPSKAKIESLMKQASSLYKAGKVAEAQALYTEISDLNKKLNEAQGRGNVLIKKVA